MPRALSVATLALRRRVPPHQVVHRRRDPDRRRGREAQGREQIVGAALGEAGQKIRASRRHQHQLGPAREFDVAHRGLGRLIPQLAAHRSPRQRLERHRRDKAAAAAVMTTCTARPRAQEPHEFGAL